MSAVFSRHVGVCGLAGPVLVAATYLVTGEPAPRIRVVWRDGITAEQRAAQEASYFLRNGARSARE